MQFEITLPHRLDVFVMRGAGIETDGYQRRSMLCYGKNTSAEFEIVCSYFFTDPPIQVRVARLDYDRDKARLRITVDDLSAGEKIRDYMTRYSVENDGEAVSDRERKAIWDKLEAILVSNGTTYEQAHSGNAPLSRQCIQELMAITAEVPHPHKFKIHDFFTRPCVAKCDRLFAGQWLVKEFERQAIERGNITCRLWDMAVPGLADDLLRIYRDPRFGESRSIIALALVRTKDPRAADEIVGVIHQDGMARYGIDALGKLGSKKHADLIREFLRDPSPDLRREAKKALKKLGFPIDSPPPPRHLIAPKTCIPTDLGEWSEGLDMNDLEPTLQKIPPLLQNGFGAQEIAEIVAVTEEMRVEQTRVFRFPITFQKRKSDLYVVIFMDDTDAPDLALHADPGLIKQLESVLDENAY